MMILCSQCRSHCNWVKEEVLEKIVKHVDMLCVRLKSLVIGGMWIMFSYLLQRVVIDCVHIIRSEANVDHLK